MTLSALVISNLSLGHLFFWSENTQGKRDKVLLGDDDQAQLQHKGGSSMSSAESDICLKWTPDTSSLMIDVDSIARGLIRLNVT
jgi:hypothetical protein